MARRGLSLGALALVVAGAVTVARPDGSGPPPRTARGAVSQDAVELGRQRLALLEVAPDGIREGYQRVEDFGPAWSLDSDRNGCKQRDDVLARDMTEVVRRDRCVVVSGVLEDPYTGKRIVFVKERAQAVQVDHVYSLGDAWRHGAAGWTKAERVAFANDLSNLLAVDGPTNARKSDRGPAEWLPPNEGYHCEFALRYLAVAVNYRLSITEGDRTRLSGVLERC